MHLGEVYTGEPGDIAAARHLASELFRRSTRAGITVAAQALAEVQLVVSEMVTNAVKFTAGPCRLDLRVADGVVEITVSDTSEQMVAALAPDPARVGRHGMEIVTALCGGFEVTVTPEGKRISAQLALRPAA
ncbi:ATP-binding protein [Streptomyces sp. NBC_01198]|uniref:ATP-binding protein n=1 Tax=Streptomyces sp. NBC_01198 TaxID=2903769 RepID=UPI002E0DA2DA|nr:ATP-binding protein [Streptomyces sp. NBC_01198]